MVVAVGRRLYRCVGRYGLPIRSIVLYDVRYSHGPLLKKFENLGGEEFEGSQSEYGIESCKIVFLWGNFLFTCSDTFAVV